MKDAATCEKLREGGEQPMIRRCPNGETLSAQAENAVRVHRKQTSGSKTFQYREEKKPIH